MNKKRVIAINLPQFHPFKENEEWWGKGFTEWTNVTKSRPRFEGHYQPHLPVDTGFYDLRLPEARQMQADLAKDYGIYGFCYYHYWFNGKQLMERPVKEILSSQEPDFPFMLCWANENWARNWDGGFTDVLIKQEYSTQDDIEHIKWLCSNVFADKRYIRINNKPVFAVYRSELFPDFEQTLSVWRKVAKEDFNMELYIIDVLFPGVSKDKVSSDASMDFQPIGVFDSGLKQKDVTLYDKFDVMPSIFNYHEYVDYAIGHKLPKHCYPCVSPGFDNSPRRLGKTFLAFEDCTPADFGRWLWAEMKRDCDFSNDEENLVFINAWNEWAEGNHIEPDRRWGRGYLEATSKAIECFNEDKIYAFEYQSKDESDDSFVSNTESKDEIIERTLNQNQSLLNENEQYKEKISSLEKQIDQLLTNYSNQESLLFKCQQDYSTQSNRLSQLEQENIKYKEVYQNKYALRTHNLFVKSKFARLFIRLNIKFLGLIHK